MDRNGDGRVERAEFDETGTAHFVRMDTDGDGRVSREELRSRRHRMGHGRYDDTLPVK
jgi:Ca2+-binding EF-hand superfamily protein